MEPCQPVPCRPARDRTSPYGRAQATSAPPIASAKRIARREGSGPPGIRRYRRPRVAAPEPFPHRACIMDTAARPSGRLTARDLRRALGPGLLWAGSAIGVSHLVQSTRAGAAAGLGLAKPYHF
jgi:hypothetical protein